MKTTLKKTQTNLKTNRFELMAMIVGLLFIIYIYSTTAINLLTQVQILENIAVKMTLLNVPMFFLFVGLLILFERYKKLI